jgi:predicted nucleic acid-binding protein
MKKATSSDIKKRVIIDTCFWFAIYTKTDQWHKRATKILDEIGNAEIVVPWPTLYEVMNTDFVENKVALTQFEYFLKKPNVTLLDDTKYKNDALQESFEKAIYKNWPISYVDIIIRNMILDTKVDIDYLVTFNEKDFIDILKKRPVEFYYS